MMNRFVLFCAAAVGFLALAARVPAEESRPNILIILADDMGYSDLSCYGSEIPTPHLDAMAAGGVKFTQFYNTSRCCPTRASLLTGLSSHEAGVGGMVYRNDGEGYLGYLNRECVTLAEVLGKAGYQTLMSGKWHVGHAEGQRASDRGFQRFYGINIHVDSYFKVLEGCPIYLDGEVAIPPTESAPNTLHPEQPFYTTDVFTDWALKFLEEKDAAKPFFLYLAYNAPHWPIEAPEENIAHFKGEYLEGWDALRERRLVRMKELGLVAEDTVLPPSENVAWADLSAEDQKELDFRRAIYAAQVERLDQNVGRVVDALDAAGELDNTLILFLSDNGCSNEKGMFGYGWPENRMENYETWRTASGRSASQGQAWACASNTPFRRHKRWVHEGGISTPLIAHWPAGIEAPGRMSDQVGHVVDLMATCVDLGQASYPEERDGVAIHPMRGMSLRPVLENSESENQERTLFFEHETHAAIRQGDWKLVTTNATDPAKWELYDMATDRVELHDLAAKHPERVRAMTAAWTEWAKDADVLPWPKER